jgi:hypothetical protein
MDRRMLLAASASAFAIPRHLPCNLRRIVMPNVQSETSAAVVEASSATRYASVDVGGINIFYRDSGPRAAPVLLLLHG